MVVIATLVLAVAFAAGLYLGSLADRNPARTWGLLGAGLVVTTALMLGGYTWYDEAFLFGFVLMNLPNLRSSNPGPLQQTRWLVFVAFCAYAGLEAVRSLIFFADIGGADVLQKLRWIVFFLAILLMAVKMRQSLQRSVRPDKTALTVMRGGLLFVVVYLVVGFGAFLTSGSFGNAQYAQSTLATSAGSAFAIFASTAYTTTAILVIVPAALIVLATKKRWTAFFGGFTVILCFASQVAYNSRTGMLLITVWIVGYVIVRVAASKSRITELALVPVLILIALTVTAVGEIPIGTVLTDLGSTLHITEGTNQDLQDIDRRIWLDSAGHALSDSDGLHAAFGYGWRTSGYVVAPYVNEQFFLRAGKTKSEEDVAVESFTALAVDGGLVGLALFGLLLAGGLVTAMQAESGRRFILAVVPLSIVAVSLVANVFDVALYYILLAPGGLLFALGRDGEGVVAHESSVGEVGADASGKRVTMSRN